MSVHVLTFQPRVKGIEPWTNEELAELYRVVDILGRAGLSVDTDMGMSDEGDPWFVFCRTDCGDVIAHFARIDGQFVAASVAVDETYRGANFRQIVERMVKSQPLVLPPAGRGTRLLMHPSVVLTAFVATALAHSEKAHADAMHAVEAKWDHAHAADAGAGRHAKVSWFDSFRSIMNEARGTSELGSTSSGQAVTLASLIAIAMAAMQPVVEKLSAVASSMVDGIHAAEAALHPAAAHVLAALADLPVFSGADIKTHDTVVVKADADSTHATHKVALDTASDAHITNDTSLAAVASAQKAVLVADDMIHVAPAPPAPVDAQQDAAAMILMNAQKAAVFLVDSASHAQQAAATTVADGGLPDVSQQALQILNIRLDTGHVEKEGAGSGVAPPTALIGGGDASGGAAGGTLAGSATGGTLVASGNGAGAGPAIVAAPQVLDVTDTNGIQVINAIAGFAASNTHLISAGYTAPADLQQALAQYETPGQSLKIIVFESTSLTADIFQFSSNVVFVEEKHLTASASLDNPGGNLVLDLAGGGVVTLVGVATIPPNLGHALV